MSNTSAPPSSSLADPHTSAQQAGLRYVSDRAAGYTRRRWGNGFSYLDSRGRRVSDPILRSRFQALVIPPAWENVWICRDPNGHILATGRDEKGRKQYIYHPEWNAVRNRTKFERMPSFAVALPALRRQVELDMQARGFPRQKVLAMLVRLLDKTLIRVGNPEYARANSSYGLTTLENEHVTVEGTRLVFTFRGKSGKQNEVELRDRQLARRMARMQELPGQRLFQYLDEDGTPQAVQSEDVNEYLRQICGQQFTAKDFRTWGGTTLAALELYASGPVESATRQKRAVSAAVKRTARFLGNTPAVCREFYIHPAILSAYEDGSLFGVMQRAAEEYDVQETGLLLEELAVRRILAASLATGGS